MTARKFCFVAESGTDVRIVDGLAERTSLFVLAREIIGGRAINRPPTASVEVSIGPASRLLFAARTFVELLRCARRTEAVVVQGYGLAALAANLASRLVGTRTFMLVCSPVELYYACRKQAANPEMPYRAYQLGALKIAAALNARIGRHYVVLSQHLKEVVGNHGTRKPISIIPVYGVDTDRFIPPAETKSAIRQQLGLPESGAIVFFSSRIAPEKDAETLLEAVAQLTASGRELWLLHLSGGHEHFRVAAGQLGLANMVIARDAVHPVNDLPAYYQASDVCVQASREEGLGFSPLEALACEVPVVAASAGGLRETIRDGETGWSYPVGDAKALASAIEAILTDHETASMRARAGREMVVAEYDTQVVFDRFVKLLESR